MSMTLAFGIVVSACSGANPLAPAAVALTPGSGTAQPAASSQAAPISVDGIWDYQEDTVLQLAGDLAPAFGLAPEGSVLQIRCSSPDGVLTLNQTGSTITGTLEHPTGSCLTKGGQAVPPPWGLPYRATLTGRITGRALHLDQLDDPPVPGAVACTKNGTIQVAGGTAVGLRTVGRCDLSGFGVRPAVATNSATGTRQ
jgi:hypothetical protein